MKKILLSTAIFVLTIFITKGQTITSSNFPSIGEEYSYFSDTLQYSPGNSGNGVSWNFSNVQFPPTLEYEYYVNPANTLNASSFPTATLAEGQAVDTNFTYYKLNANEYTVLGSISGTQLQQYSDPITLSNLPMSFNSVTTDNFSGTINSQFGNFTINGNLNGIADAVGTITLPGSGGTVQCLRYKAIINQTITLSIFGSVVNKSTQYLWFSPTTKNVVFQLSKDSSVTNFSGQPTTTSVSYSVRQKQGMVLTGTNEFSTSNFLELFPNPASNKARVLYSAKQNELISINIFDVSGKLVQSINETANGNSSSVDLEISNWERGIYFVQITQDKHQVTKKLVVR
jgi:hypothetical protein